MTTPPASQEPQLTDEERAFLEADTLQNVPVVRAPLPPRPPRLPWEAVLAGGAAATVIAAMLVLYLTQQPLSPQYRAQGSSAAIPPNSAAGPGPGDDAGPDGGGAQREVPGPVEPPALVAPSPVAPDPLPALPPDADLPGDFLPGPPGGDAADCVPVSYRTPGGTTACLPVAEVCAPGSPWYTPHGDEVCGGPVPTQHIRVATLPAAGATAGAVHCLAWTDLGDPGRHGGARDLVEVGADRSPGDAGGNPSRSAELLVDLPADRCSAYLTGADGLAYRAGGGSVFSSVPLQCESAYPGTRLSYPGVLESTADAGPPLHVCVSERIGA
ncbi:hypothetical protein [Streptomyces bohaiensis]|uniref:Uncharacterized protein n=1 Tax=Streptomyces bohaiensis TaxID=1431344 RepID=A0ABX1C895_9ACTN|nr:hypothetical protein [Streptomyces bohaiensis]NJQ13557.1 hypothetical protein [Streptomyces bohaiensis]